jgi:thiaminase
MPSLTSHLIHLDPSALTHATEHPFLTAAAHATCPAEKLKHWLAQDRLYQLAYVNFIGAMLSHLPLPAGADRETSLEWRAADLLIDCLTNIRQEMRLFEDAARGEGWYEDICAVDMARETRAYQDLFAGATAQGRPLVVGLTVLWATEECYLRAWRFAWGQMDEEVRKSVKEGRGEEEGRDVMQRTFIPNWSSPGFEAFVRRIGGLVNRYGGFYDRESWEWGECERAWRQVLWAEKEFWPSVE